MTSDIGDMASFPNFEKPNQFIRALPRVKSAIAIKIKNGEAFGESESPDSS